ncbi:MAG: hypothetical protein WC823_04755 [Parcubacteria group bacterium]|jgi:hypothetical protein
MIQPPLLRLDKEEFPITVDYAMSLDMMYESLRKNITWSGAVELKDRTFPFNSGVKDFVCCYATLMRKESDLSEIWEYSQSAQINLADMKQLFAFGCAYMRMAVTKEKITPIVAAAEGSTWLCSHDCLDELAGIDWDGFYHNPGPRISTFSGPFEVGTRFLAIR